MNFTWRSVLKRRTQRSSLPARYKREIHLGRKGRTAVHVAGAVDDAPHGTVHPVYNMFDWLLWTRCFRKTQTERELCSRQEPLPLREHLLRVRFSSGSESDLRTNCESVSVLSWMWPRKHAFRYQLIVVDLLVFYPSIPSENWSTGK